MRYALYVPAIILFYCVLALITAKLSTEMRVSDSVTVTDVSFRGTHYSFRFNWSFHVPQFNHVRMFVLGSDFLYYSLTGNPQTDFLLGETSADFPLKVSEAESATPRFFLVATPADYGMPAASRVGPRSYAYSGSEFQTVVDNANYVAEASPQTAIETIGFWPLLVTGLTDMRNLIIGVMAGLLVLFIDGIVRRRWR